MTEQTPGLELFLSSEKAVQGAAKFRDAVESAAQAVERIGAVVDRLDGLLDRLGASAKSAAPALTKLGDSASKVGTSFNTSGAQAQRYESRLGRLGVTAGGVARQLTLMLGAAGAISGIAGAVAAFSDYEDKLRILGSIAGATGAQLKKLEGAAVDLSRNSRFTPREGLQGLTELSRAGLDAEQAITALKPTADLARVGLLGLGDASAIVTKTLTQFALGADQASRVADVLAKAANISNADVGTLADALAKTGPVARQFNVSLEDTVATLARLADNGLAANIAGTGLQRVLIQLRNPTEEAQRALLGLGLTAEKINPEKVGLTGALQNLRDAGVSVQDSVSLVGTEFASLLTILTGSVGSIEQVGETLRGSTGEAAKQAAAGADTLAAAFADLRGASEQFAVSASRGGIGQALTDITRTGAEVLRVLAGDKQAMEEAGTAAKLLATGLQLATVAGAAFASAKLAATIADVAGKMKLATVATAAYAAATGSAVERALVANRAFAALSNILSKNWFVIAATGIAAAVSALVVFGEKSEEVNEDLEKQRSYAKSLEDQYRALAVAIADASRGPGEFTNNSKAAENLRRANEEARNFARSLEAIGEAGRTPIQGVVALAGLDQEAARIKQFIDQYDELRDAAKKTAEEVRKETFRSFPSDRFSGGAIAANAEANRKAREVEAELVRQITEAGRSLGIVFDENGQKVIENAKALEIARRVLQSLEEQASKTGVALEKVGQGPKDDLSSSVRALIAERERELELAKLTGVEREKAVLIADAEKRAGQGLNDTEKERIGLLAKAVVDNEKLAAQKRKEAQEAEKLAEQQRDLPKNLAALQKQYSDELATAKAVGLQRELISAAIKAENDAKAIGLSLDEKQAATLEKIAAAASKIGLEGLAVSLAGSARDRAKALEKLKKDAEESARLAFEERQQKKETRVDKRQDEAMRQLAQEEQLLRLSGAERERYRILIEAENEARQAGLELGTAEYQDFIRRKTEVRELAAVQEQLAQAAGQFAASWTSALEQFIIDAGKSRDVARALWQDLQRLAFRQTAGAGLNSLFLTAAQALGGIIAGQPSATPAGSAAGSAGGSAAGGAAGGAVFRAGGGAAASGASPRLLGGLIPAMNGVVIDSPSYLQRGANTYGVAEGGETTPEAVFRLAKDERGQLGVRAVGGGGGDTFNMSFPAVRTAQDARAMRSTMGQQLRALKAGDRKGRRGRRPAGE